MFLDSQGRLLYSSDPQDAGFVGQTVSSPGLSTALNGEEIVLTNYSALRLNNILIDVFSPVISSNQGVTGIVRVTYRLDSLYDVFSNFRFLIAAVLVMGLMIGILLGSLLAVNIGKPVGQVTRAIYGIANGQSNAPLAEQGPEEMRDQVRAINFLVERLHTLEQSRRQLLANLVHELGRPLGALRSAIQALSKGAGNDPRLLADLTEGMDEEAARLQHILDDLAHLHDQVLGSLELANEPINLREWLPVVLTPWQEAAQEKKLHWQVSLPDGLPVIRGDKTRLAQVVGNLVSNAIKYTPTNGTVEVTAGVGEQQVWIQISDDGPGIPLAEQEKIFEPFYRGQQDRRVKQGMGLGLSIAKDLIQAHGGRIDVDSSPGVGSRFTVWILLPDST
jgi:signal transduction histidine kinase